MRMFKLLATLMASTPAFSQLLSVGVKGGVPLTDPFGLTGPGGVALVTGAPQYTVGATAELHLPAHISIEVDALYRRKGFTLTDNNLGGPVVLGIWDRAKANEWEFPGLLKYELLRGPMRPFIDAGPTVRHFSGFSNTSLESIPLHLVQQLPTPIESYSQKYVQNATSPGVTGGIGVDLTLSRIRISPEFRYTHWGNDTYGTIQGFYTIHNRNQADFLLGLTF